MTSEFLDNKKNKILELSTRKKIYVIVKKHAGSHFREIERLSNLSSGIVTYHLDYLTKHELIREEKEDNNVRYFPQEFSESNGKLLSLLRQKSIRTILLCLLEDRTRTHDDIVRFVNLSPSTVSWHLKKLERKGIIKINREKIKTQYILQVKEDDIIKLLIQYKESFLDTLVDRVVDMWDV